MATKTPRKPTAKTTRIKTVDDYLETAPKDRRAVLTKLRQTIKAAAPKATEGIGYGLVAYKLDGKYVVYFGNWKAHVALYGTGHSFINAHPAEVEGYVMSKGTLRFPADKPLPYGLVTKIVKARLAEIEKDG